MKPSRIEQETVILYNEAELTAEVYTCDKKLLEKLERLEGKYPEKIVKKSEQTYIVPKACVLIREPYSEQRRARKGTGESRRICSAVQEKCFLGRVVVIFRFT